MVKIISKHRVNMLIDIKCIDHPCMESQADLDTHYALITGVSNFQFLE